MMQAHSMQLQHAWPRQAWQSVITQQRAVRCHATKFVLPKNEQGFTTMPPVALAEIQGCTVPQVCPACVACSFTSSLAFSLLTCFPAAALCLNPCVCRG